MADNQSLDQVLIELRNNYDIQTSFNHSLASNCFVSDSSSYSSAKEAIEHLINSCNLAYEQIGSVFIIFEKSSKEFIRKKKNEYFYFSGQLIDGINTESLPFSNIQTNTSNFVADVNGNFSFRTNNSIEKLQISHIGYYLLDTLLSNGNNKQIKLIPSAIGLEEVVVSSNTKIFNSYIGEKAGLLKLNNKIASFLPGNNNNTLFNLLRLQPGILAAAEQNSDYSIWGSYRGEVLIKFDGIPLFSASSLNNEIGVVNPLIVKDVEVLKGGYDVDKGDRVGGIINMTGKTGNPDVFTANMNLNSQTVSGILNIPIEEEYALQAAFRQSYYGIINWDEVVNRSQDNLNESYTPDYTFSDMNIKFSQKTNNGDDFYISLIGSKDISSVVLLSNELRREKTWEHSREKNQLGGSAFYNKNWERSGKTNISFSYSTLITNSVNRLDFSTIRGVSNYYDYYRENSIQEISIKTEHQFPTLGSNTISVGGVFINNRTTFIDDSVKINLQNKINTNNRFSGYIKDNIVMDKSFMIRPSIKFDFLNKLNNFYIQPQIDALILPHPNWKINIAWGMYNQYITEMALVDELGNQYYFWGISNDDIFPVVSGIHNLLGVSYKNDDLILNVEGYYKTSLGLSRYNLRREIKSTTILNGKSRAYGVDFFWKQKIENHDFWISYTISRVEENFSSDIHNEYRRARHDQTHEIKGAAIINSNPWYFSMNYVYGSGLLYTTFLPKDGIIPYSRLDIALLYKFDTQKFNLETGVSIVNLLNIENVGYSSISNLPDGRKIYPRGIPFTPSLFLNIGF